MMKTLTTGLLTTITTKGMRKELHFVGRSQRTMIQKTFYKSLVRVMVVYSDGTSEAHIWKA